MSALTAKPAIIPAALTWLCRVLLLVLTASPAMAWNSAGHRIVAMIAWERLDKPGRQAVTAILRQHPDYDLWQLHAKGGDPDLTAFVEAATWPDDIRQDKRFYTADTDAPTPTLDGFPDMERRLTWHYVDRPVGPARNPLPSPGVIDRQLPALMRVLGNRRATPSERAYALPWLIHLIGDAHQPLHTASRYAVGGQSDNGGNRVMIINPFHTRYPSMSLHRYWDDLPGPPWLRGSRVEETAALLARRYAAPNPIGTAELWLDESWQLARLAAYPAGDEEPTTISAEFHARSREIANRRLAEAGYRLADTLRRILRED